MWLRSSCVTSEGSLSMVKAYASCQGFLSCYEVSEMYTFCTGKFLIYCSIMNNGSRFREFFNFFCNVILIWQDKEEYWLFFKKCSLICEESFKKTDHLCWLGYLEREKLGDFGQAELWSNEVLPDELRNCGSLKLDVISKDDVLLWPEWKIQVYVKWKRLDKIFIALQKISSGCLKLNFDGKRIRMK